MSELEKWAMYEREKQEYLRNHPGATGKEIEQACREIARRLRI
jgi:hypothetical protein